MYQNFESVFNLKQKTIHEQNTYSKLLW